MHTRLRRNLCTSHEQKGPKTNNPKEKTPIAKPTSFCENFSVSSSQTGKDGTKMYTDIASIMLANDISQKSRCHNLTWTGVFCVFIVNDL